MNNLVKSKWVAALRSGEYWQVQGRLRRDTGNCCLGVLCDLHAIETGGTWSHNCEEEYEYFHHSGTLPDVVVSWAGLPIGYETMCANMNDRGLSFHQIADFIESSGG